MTEASKTEAITQEAIDRLQFNADFQRGYGGDHFFMSRADADLILHRLATEARNPANHPDQYRLDMAAALRNTPAEALREGGYLERAAEMLEQAEPVAGPTLGDMAAFGASEYACYLYPGEHQQAERAAFCDGAAHQVTANHPDQATRAEREVERMGEALFRLSAEILSAGGFESENLHVAYEATASAWQRLTAALAQPTITEPVESEHGQG